MNDWTTEIETLTRDDVMRVCSILAEVLKDSIQSGERRKVIIVGDFSNGKGAIVDGITAAVADDITPDKLPEVSLYEDGTCDAHGQTLTKHFNSGQMAIINTMYHFHHNAEPAAEPAGGRPVCGGLDFETYLCLLAETPPSLRIEFQYGESSPAQPWSRNWVINVKDTALQTPKMAEALSDLGRFHEHILARSFVGERQIDSVNDL